MKVPGVSVLARSYWKEGVQTKLSSTPLVWPYVFQSQIYLKFCGTGGRMRGGGMLDMKGRYSERELKEGAFCLRQGHWALSPSSQKSTKTGAV
jgi:hypothetical protein